MGSDVIFTCRQNVQKGTHVIFLHLEMFRVCASRGKNVICKWLFTYKRLGRAHNHTRMHTYTQYYAGAVFHTLVENSYKQRNTVFETILS